MYGKWVLIHANVLQYEQTETLNHDIPYFHNDIEKSKK